MGGNQMKHFLSERNFLNNSIIIIMIIIQHRAYIVVIKLSHTKRKVSNLLCEEEEEKCHGHFFGFAHLGQQDTCDVCKDTYTGARQ